MEETCGYCRAVAVSDIPASVSICAIEHCTVLTVVHIALCLLRKTVMRGFYLCCGVRCVLIDRLADITFSPLFIWDIFDIGQGHWKHILCVCVCVSVCVCVRVRV